MSAITKRELLHYQYSPVSDVIEIEGIKYSGDLFRQFGRVMPLNTPLKIMARDDGVLVVTQMEPWDRDWALTPEESPDEHGFSWNYELLDFGRLLAICGRVDDAECYQQRYAVDFRIALLDPNGSESRAKIARAKDLIRTRIAEGRGIKGDDRVAGREERLPE